MSGNGSENNFKTVYFTESRELLDSMESSLLALEKDRTDQESINSVFRAAHTIKGSSGMFGFGRIGSFTHVLENVLVCVREGSIIISDELFNLLFECHDYLILLLDFFEDSENTELPGEMENIFTELLRRLDTFLPKQDEASTVDSGKSGKEGEPDDRENICSESDDISVCNDCWHVSIRFGRNVFIDGLDPFPFISYLGEKGEIVRMKTVYDGMPSGDEMNPEICYIGFEIDLRNFTNKKEIEDIFEFVKGDCELRILQPNTSISNYVKLIEQLPETPMRIGDMLREIGSLTSSELELALKLQAERSAMKNSEPDKLLVGSIMVEEKMVHKYILDAALAKQDTVKKREDSNRKLIRIDSEKLDHLINLIGELVITGSNVKQISESEERIGLVKAVTDMSKLIEEIRDSTMGIRMMQIGETFSRYERVVRDLCREKGKQIELQIFGGDTELDKTLVDKISDPLIHLIRNAVDHGINLPAEREKAGKNPVGTITLNAYHETGSIVIEVSDDGAGLDRERIFTKAVELGMVRADAVLPEEEVFQFIFQPGFSTAEKVTDISGRGVGMDVVKKNIESLRGTVSLESTRGAGTTIRIHLPLTLAIIDGFMVRLADSYYVFPLDMVTECTEIARVELDSKEGGNFINLRGDVLPFMKMREFFQIEGDVPLKQKIIVVEHARKRVGLVVDDLIGEFQTVIKPLGKIFSNLQWISGSTILGTGEVAYILDIPKLIKTARLSELSSI